MFVWNFHKQFEIPFNQYVKITKISQKSQNGLFIFRNSDHFYLKIGQ
jgi:hypothetical protein